MSPLVSIVLTVFNINPTYLTECLSSIRAQTYKNIEIIIIDRLYLVTEVNEL